MTVALTLLEMSQLYPFHPHFGELRAEDTGTFDKINLVFDLDQKTNF